MQVVSNERLMVGIVVGVELAKVSSIMMYIIYMYTGMVLCIEDDAIHRGRGM